MREEILIDTRELPSPEPMERVVEKLGMIDASHYLKMVHRMEPVLLFSILDKNGFAYRVKKSGDAVWVYIYAKNDRETAGYIGVL